MITVFNTSAIGGKGKEKSSVHPPSAKSEQKELKRSKNKRGALLSKNEAKSSHPLDLSNRRKEFQKLSAQELRKKGMAWIPKGSIQTQGMGDDQTKGAI
jgi:primase-polymerase (primpol)-like protein